MKKYILAVVLTMVMLLSLTACANSSQEGSRTSYPAASQGNAAENQTSTDSGKESEVIMPKDGKVSSGKILIAYFTLVDNYEKPSEMDATSQASINLENNELIGNTEYLANAIQAETGGDLFSVVVKKPYPNDYDKITDMGSEEQDEDARPELSSHIENMDQYQTVFVGFPIWLAYHNLIQCTQA